MKTATGLAMIAVGAILAFAVTAHPSGLNLQAAGWVLILIGLAGMFVPRRGYGWLRRRVVRRSSPRRTTVLARPGGRNRLPANAVVLAPEETDEVVTAEAEPDVFPGRTISLAEAEEMAPTTPAAGSTETIEEYREE